MSDGAPGLPAGRDCAGSPFPVAIVGGSVLAATGDSAHVVRRARCKRAEVVPRDNPWVAMLQSLALFGLAALAEIGGAWLVWQGVREERGVAFIGLGIMALALYGFVATFQPDPHFGRILAAYGGVFVAGSLAWGALVDGFRPDRWDLLGAAICLIGVAVIMYAPRPAVP